MRRWQAMAGIAAGVALTAGACGVQPTGVNVASTSPFSVSQPSQAPSASSAAGSVQVRLFLVPKSPGFLHEVVHYVAKEPHTATDLVPYLREVDDDDSANNLTTSVPPGFTLEPTSSAHEYIIVGTLPNSQAMNQLTCTFALYWRNHRDGQKASTRFLRPDGTVYRNWDDCASLLGEDVWPGPVAGRPTKTAPAVAATPSVFGN